MCVPKQPRTGTLNFSLYFYFLSIDIKDVVKKVAFKNTNTHHTSNAITCRFFTKVFLFSLPLLLLVPSLLSLNQQFSCSTPFVWDVRYRFMNTFLIFANNNRSGSILRTTVWQWSKTGNNRHAMSHNSSNMFLLMLYWVRVEINVKGRSKLENNGVAVIIIILSLLCYVLGLLARRNSFNTTNCVTENIINVQNWWHSINYRPLIHPPNKWSDPTVADFDVSKKATDFAHWYKTEWSIYICFIFYCRRFVALQLHCCPFCWYVCRQSLDEPRQGLYSCFVRIYLTV